MAAEDAHDAFSSSRLWVPSALFQDVDDNASTLFAPLQIDVPSIRLTHPYAPKASLDRELQLPDIDAFDFGPLPEIESLHVSSESLDTPPTQSEADDVWQAALELGPANEHITFFTWETFENPSNVESSTAYLTEAGPRAFDAALAADEASAPSGRLLASNVLLASLWNLGLGRESVLFTFDAKKRSFVPAVVDGRQSGLSLRVAQSITTQFMHTGNTFVYIRSFVERTFAAGDAIPARVALAASVSSIMSSFEDHLGRQCANIKSLLELQRLFAKPRDILNHIARTIDAVKYTKTNEQLSSILHNRVLEIEEGDDALRRLICGILCRVTEPNLHLIEEWIGLREEQAVPFHERGSFVGIDNGSEQSSALEYVYHASMMPRFVSPEDGNMIFETGNSLRFLKLHHPEHPLAAPGRFSINTPSLEWRFEWQDIEAISNKAKRYEEELQKAIMTFSQHQPQQRFPAPTTSAAGPPQDEGQQDIANLIEESKQLFDAPPQPLFGALPDELQLLTEQILTAASPSRTTNSTFSPPLPLASTLSFRPLLASQANLVNSTTIRLFLRSHQLRLHLSLQRQYHLFGDGVFSARLASALFDPERESAERHKGRMRSGVHMGLQLGARDSWPPASSELRLALMGVLTESYYSSALYYSTQSGGAHPSCQREDNDELPGQLNFAVRNLTEPEMEKIMDPYALYALDFLRLQYVAPSPLNLVITPSALDKYDTIFKFLLRLQRMLFVIAHLPRQYPDPESRLFRVEAHHFVTALSQYIFQTGIAEHWDAFDTYVSTVEQRLAEEDSAAQPGTRLSDGIASLRIAHEACLDSILFSLLLRGRQRNVMALMEEIFELILLFAKSQIPGMQAQMQDSARDLYSKLRGKIKVFLSVCRQLTGKKGYGKGKGTVEENTLARLDILLEMNGYYAKGAA